MILQKLILYKMVSTNQVFKKLYLLKVSTSLIILFSSFTSNSQTNDLNDIQYGAVIRATIDLNWLNNNPCYSNFNVFV